MLIGSLFSGIGGLELGLERALGWGVAWQVESDRFCRDVLARHWPEAQRFEDVKSVSSTQLRRVDLICGGFPCQDVSGAGLGRGLRPGTRSGLWFEFARIVGELMPRWVVVENVASGASRWLCQVRADLHALEYRSRAFRLSAADVGASHLRRRIFVVGHADSDRCETTSLEPARRPGKEQPDEKRCRLLLADADSEAVRERTERKPERRTRGVREPESAVAVDLGQALADGDGFGLKARSSGGPHDRGALRRHADGRHDFPPRRGDVAGWDLWDGPQPGICRVPHGISTGVDGDEIEANDVARLRALGNAVVPACAEVIGRLIAAEESKR